LVDKVDKIARQFNLPLRLYLTAAPLLWNSLYCRRSKTCIWFQAQFLYLFDQLSDDPVFLFGRMAQRLN